MIDYIVRFGERVRNYFSSREEDRPLSLSDICRLSRLVEEAKIKSLRPRVPYSGQEND